jgi:uncharacterized membrane-anchored protein
MSTRVKVALLAGLSLLQLGATASSIVRYESTLRTGVLYRIPTAPVDPIDAFRGRYVAVRPAIVIPNPIAADSDALLQRIQAGEKGYVILAADADGFARAAAIRMERPPEGDYLEITSVFEQWSRDPQPNGAVTRNGYSLSFPFDRYYMNAARAPQAELRYAEAARRNAATRAWVGVRVRNGIGVIEGLFVDGVRIEDAIAGAAK